jgi:dTDP-4-dehydrorhamnose reductase
MRIVVTGKRGQLVQALSERAAVAGATVVPVGRPELDLAQADVPCRELFASQRPDIIVSAAAYTAVDKAESESATAYAVNAEGARTVASAAASLGVPVIHISTDYVFDGTKAEPWTEDDVPAPLNVYGASKLAGEKAVLEAANGNVVLRVGWVYSPFGTNFVKTILRLAGEHNCLRIVGDQIGGPTSAFDIADGVLTVARNILGQPDRRDMRGLFHMGSGSTATWAEFARGIADWLSRHEGREITVEEITSRDFPTQAQRPANSCLDSQKLSRVHGVRLPPWQTSLPLVLERLTRIEGSERLQSRTS